MITTEIISFATVLFTAVCVASLISILYAWGLRMWADGSVDAQGNAHLMHRVISSFASPLASRSSYSPFG